jgi:hypothetical protein
MSYNINITPKFKFRTTEDSNVNNTGNNSIVTTGNFVEKWEVWNADLTVSGVTYSDNFIFNGEGDTGGIDGSGSSVTSISFLGTTLSLSQTGLSDLSATFTLTEGDIPALSINKITGLQTALDNAGTSISIGSPANGLSLVSGELSLALASTSIAGAMSASDKLKLDNIEANANNYVHPLSSWTSKSNLSGNVVISNLQVDSLGHITDWTTRPITASNIGAEPAFSKGSITIGTGLISAGTLTGRLVNTGNINIGLDLGYLTGNYVTIDTDQTITGEKTFTKDITGTNFIFDGEGGSGGIGGGASVTGISFVGTTLSLSQTGLSDLTASITLTEGDIPALSINKITGLQTALNNKADESQLHLPVTLGTSTNGLSLVDQVLSLALASTTIAGAMSASDKLKLDNIEANANNYVHPTYTALNPTLTGATVLASITTNTIGSVTGITTRVLTPANIGAESAFSKGSITIGTGITSAGTLTNRLVSSGNINIGLDLGYLNSNYVTLDTAQTITGEKTFTEDITGTNFIFDGEGGTGGIGGGASVTGISFLGNTLFLSQTGLSDLTASITLTASDVGAEPAFSKGSIVSGSGISLSGSGINRLISIGNLTISNTDRGSAQNIFKNIANSAGTTQFSADSNNDSIRFAGTGATSVSFNSSTNTITISSTDTNTNTTYSAGTGLSLAGTVFSNTDRGSSQNIFKNIAVSGQSTVVADNNNDTLTLVAGTNVTITTNTTSDSITISATDTNTTYSAGAGLSLAGTVFSHSDTSSQGSVNNSNGTVIQDITLDTYGHITGINSVNLDSRYALSSRSINTGTGLAGGGNLTSDRTISLTGQALTFHSLATNGLIYRSGGTIGTRSLIAGTGITITNADGQSGNPIINFDTSVIDFRYPRIANFVTNWNNITTDAFVPRFHTGSLQASNAPSGANYWSTLTFRHQLGGVYESVLMTGTTGSQPELYIRNRTNGTWGSYGRVMHMLNMDELQVKFARSWAEGSDGILYYGKRTGTNANAVIRLETNTSGSTYLGRGNSSNAFFAVGTSGDLSSASNRVFTIDNQGVVTATNFVFE